MSRVCCYCYSTDCDCKKKRRSIGSMFASTRKWRELRLQYLAIHPLCEICLEDNRVVSAEVVHHKVKHGGEYKLQYDINNLQSLCTKHHNHLTGRGE